MILTCGWPRTKYRVLYFYRILRQSEYFSGKFANIRIVTSTIWNNGLADLIAKITVVLRITFPNGVSWMKITVIWFKLTIGQRCFGWWYGTDNESCFSLQTHKPLQWRHNGRNSVSNHQPHDCLLNGLFGRRSKKTWKLRVTGLCVGNSPETGEFPHKWPVTLKMFPFDDVIKQITKDRLSMRPREHKFNNKREYFSYIVLMCPFLI